MTTFTIEEIQHALATVKVDSNAKQASELVDMLASCGEQRGDMMLEYTRQAFLDFQRQLMKQLGAPVPCGCGVEGCTGERTTCGHWAEVRQLELEALQEQGHEC